jgi:hypothetical protein
MADTPLQDRPSTPRAEYVIAAPDLALVRNLLAGTRCMQAEAKEYIPKWPAEKPLSYKRRAAGAKVYGGLGRTLSAAVGMLFAREPEQTEGWTPEIEQHAENIDGKGTALKVFAKRKAEDATADGFTCILVDHPTAPADVVVHGGNEAELNLRPLWSSYTRADVLSWRTAVVDNVETVIQVVLREGSAVPVGKFGTAARVLYRVCYLGTVPSLTQGQPPETGAAWVLLEEVKENGEVRVVERDRGVFRNKVGAPFRHIPLAIAYAGRTDATLTAHPPLLDVAYANLEHWRVATNLRYYEDLCCFPQPTIEGERAADSNGTVPPFQLGPGVLVQVTQGSKFLWSEVSGTSIQALRASLEEKKNEIAELGMSFLAKKTRGVETAEAKRLDSTAENSTLATAAQGIEDGINQALIYHAEYLGIAPENAPVLKINKDFDSSAMDAPTMLAYVAAVRDAGLPIRMLLESWLAGGRLPAGTDIDKLELEIEAALVAKQQQEAQAAKDAAALKQQPPAKAA